MTSDLNERFLLSNPPVPTGSEASRKRVAIAFREAGAAPEVNVGQGRETVQDRASSHICQLAGMAERKMLQPAAMIGELEHRVVGDRIARTE